MTRFPCLRTGPPLVVVADDAAGCAGRRPPGGLAGSDGGAVGVVELDDEPLSRFDDVVARARSPGGSVRPVPSEQFVARATTGALYPRVTLCGKCAYTRVRACPDRES